LHDLWPSPELVDYIYIFGRFYFSDGILPRAKFTLHPSLAFSYIGSVTAWHSSSSPQPNFAVWYMNGITELSQTPPTRLSTYGSHPAFTPQPQSISTLWPVLISRHAEGRRLSWPEWLGEILRWFARSKAVTHPSICRGGRKLSRQSSSRESNVLPLYHRAT